MMRISRLFSGSLLAVLLFSAMDFSDRRNPCEIFGKIYIVTDPSIAHYRVYVEESESAADVRIFQESSSLYADREGHWHFVNNKSFANYYVYIDTQRSMSDFSIYYTEYDAFAGCNN